MANLDLKRESQLFRYALMFYTRIPVGSLKHYDQSLDDHASRYFTAIGWLVGGLCALVFVLAHAIFPVYIAVLLSTAFGIWLTGAFHEDGLADCCDGLGGGWSTEKILEIMKDSRIGTYGFAGLSLVLASKITALASLPIEWISMAMVCAHVLSRWCACATMYWMTYVRLDETSKAKPITKGFARKDFIIAGCIALPALWCLLPANICALIGMIPFAAYLAWQLKKWLGGYTGDTLGAMQQVTELGFYLGLLASLS